MKEPAGQPETRKSKAVQVDLPSPWQKYANYVLIPLIIGLTAYLLVRFRLNAAADAKAADQRNLTEVRQQLSRMRQLDLTSMRISPAQLSTIRNSNHSDVDKMIDSLLDSTKDPIIRAEAMVARGDLNWITGTFPELPGATTNPSLQAKLSSEDYLNAATAAYTTVLKEYPTNQTAAVSARLGLGAIAENKRDWNEARKQYQAVIDEKTVPTAFSESANARLAIMKTIEAPVFIGTPKTMTALEAMTAAATTQSTQPTTQAIATTMPTTLPATSPSH